MDSANKCDGQCQNCSLIQQSYCSSARLHALMQHEQVLFQKIANIEGKLEAIEHRLNPESLIIAQGGDGAVKVAEEN